MQLCISRGCRAHIMKLDWILMLPKWGSIYGELSQGRTLDICNWCKIVSLDTWVDLSLECGYYKSNRLACGHANRCTIVSLMFNWLSIVTWPLTLMSMGERMTWKTYCILVFERNVEKYAKGREWLNEDLIDEEDSKIYTYLVFLELDVFHLCCHQCQRGRLLAWMLMIFLWGSITRNVSMMICCIHDCVCHWCQHNSFMWYLIEQ